MNDVEELTVLVRPRPGQGLGLGAGQGKPWTLRPNPCGPPLTPSCEGLVSMRNAS